MLIAGGSIPWMGILACILSLFSASFFFLDDGVNG